MGARKRSLFIAASFVLVILRAASAGGLQENWIEVRSPHFIVMSDAGEDNARRVATLMETIREIYVQALPGVAPRDGAPLPVFAVRNRDGVRALLPQYAEFDDQRLPVGFYLRTTDKNFVVLLDSAESENPYEVVFHEYFHSLAMPAAPWAPTWFHEGIAEFWENTLIRNDYVETGRPSAQNMQILENERLLPLEELLTADRAFVDSLSAYRVNAFYAQSWALIHYMMLGDRTHGYSERITPYLQYVRDGQTSVEAFEAAFGAIEDLEREVDQYLHRFRFQALRIDRPQGIEDADHAARPLAAHEYHARVGDYFVHTGHPEEARAELDEALRLDPNDSVAMEALGVLAYRNGDAEEARARFEQAASLNGALSLSRYYLAIIDMASGLDAAGRERVKANLERAVQMNAAHAPSLARLALLYDSAGEQPDLALTLARRAASLSPDSPFAQLAHGITAKSNGQMIEARRALATATRLAPDYAPARAELEEVERILEHPLSGSWAFEGLQGWVQFDVDGRALRCRVVMGGRLARDTGTVDGSSVTWIERAADGAVTESFETASLEGGTLHLDSERASFTLRRTRYVPESCEPLFE
ncbi:MAG: tetratricopeptide repeat protein [Acidobacteriota bacterium]|jgi:tetratricopeptide (TPR) repeat protein